MGAGRWTEKKWEIMWLMACHIHHSKHSSTGADFTLSVKRWQFLFTNKSEALQFSRMSELLSNFWSFLCSIYEKLIQFCSIDELGTNYPKVRCSNFVCQGERWYRAVSSYIWLSLPFLFRGPVRNFCLILYIEVNIFMWYWASVPPTSF